MRGAILAFVALGAGLAGCSGAPAEEKTSPELEKAFKGGPMPESYRQMDQQRAQQAAEAAMRDAGARTGP